jgi:DNA polymerase-3 subunit alpha
VILSDEPILVTGKVRDEGDAENRQHRLFMDSAIPLARARAEKTTRIHIRLPADQVKSEQVEELKSLLRAHPGSCSAFIHVVIPLRSETVIPLGPEFSVAPSDDLLLRLDRLFGTRVAILG